MTEAAPSSLPRECRGAGATRLTAAAVRAFRGRLLSWYRRNARILPWRQTRDPYAIWVSEAMLQQTQVATVIPYYERFLRRFPTVQRLAEAPVTEVLDHWSGLGYYSRAKNLHAGAREVLERHDGKIPDQPEALQQLPGIGRYTAGAIASIAFDRPAPLVDGNVVRVLSRYFGFRQDPGTPAMQKRLWELADRLVCPEAPGDFNQSLMELGATVCLPRSPSCRSCPISSGCMARRKNWQEKIPPPKTEAPRKKLVYLCGILEKNGKVLLARRPLTGLLPGLWEFPGGESTSPAAAAGEALSRILLEKTGLRAFPAGRPVTVQQTLSHRQIEIRAFRCPFEGRLRTPERYLELRWAPKRALGRVGFTAGMRRTSQIFLSSCSTSA